MKGILDRLLLQHNPDALLAISENGEILHWNDAAEAIFGYSCDEALGRLLNDLIVPPDRRDEERRIREDALRHGLAVYESVRRRKDGLLLHVSVTTKAIRDAGGNLECFLSTKKDVTHLKVLRDAKLVESKFRDLLESTPDAIVMVNITGRVVLINSQAENVFGYRRAEMMGQPVEMLLPQRFHAAHHGHRGQFFAQPRTRTMGAGLELYGLRKNGEEFPVEISLSTLSTDGGFGQRTDNEDVLSLYREIFSLVPAENLALYNWSLACGRVNGFSNVCGRTNVEEIAGNTHFHGQYPFAGIAYASVRSDREAVNFAFNDLGMTFVSLNNAQWVQLQSDGSLTLMDLALPSPDGILHWQGRPTILQIEPGQRVRLLKVSENSWLVESLDGDLPLFT